MPEDCTHVLLADDYTDALGAVVAETLPRVEDAYVLLDYDELDEGFDPVVHRSYLTTLSAQFERDSFDAEIIAEPDVVSALSDFSTTLVDPFVQHESLSLYRTEEKLPYALWLMETPTGTHAGITVYDSGGVAGTIVNDSAGAVTWAREIYQGYREQAQRVTASGI